MSRAVWRISTDAPTYHADDLSGAGAQKTGGRWNLAGTPLIYSASSRSLACLETLVHLGSNGLPLNRYLVSIEIPDDVWARAVIESEASLPVGWNAEPASITSTSHGMDWIASLASAIMLVPSVIVPEEHNILINPAHPDTKRISSVKVRRWNYDPRLVRTAN